MGANSEAFFNMNVLESCVLNTPIEANRLSLSPVERQPHFEIRDTQTGQCLGRLHRREDATHRVELFWGKGGFMGMVTSPKGGHYFALPGSSVCVGGVELSLAGQPITGNPAKQPAESKAYTPQAYSMQATILGAGLATRFERISGDSTHYSKPAVPLSGHRSVIECIANRLVAHGFRNIIVNTFFKPESLMASLSRCQEGQVAYIHESEPSGTAGGLRKMLTESQYQPLLDLNQPLLVVQGDSVTDADFSALMEAHVSQGALLTIGCQWVDEQDVDKFGIIVTDQSGADGQSGKIAAFQEKPKREEAKSRLANTGFYIFSPRCFPLIVEIYNDVLATAQQKARQAGAPLPTEAALDFATDIFPVILERSQAQPELGAFWAQKVDGYWSDIGNPVQYLETIHDLYAGKVQIPLPEETSLYYRDGIIYWEGAQAMAESEQAVLQGNVLVALPFAG
jgi:NDP-sugar pyrophosphorylase family protein